MDVLVTHLDAYLHEVLNTRTLAKPWPGGKRLPVFFNTRYKVYQARLFKTDCLIMAPRDAGDLTPAEIEKHVQILETQAGLLCIYLAPAITPFNRKRLIERGVQFVVPYNQMFLPRLGLDLREHFKRPKDQKRNQLGPAAQAALIYYLLHGHAEPINPTLLTQWLRYTRMTMTRVLDEFVAAGLGQVEEKGRERWFTFAAQRKKLWNQALPLMRTPVKRRFRALRDKRNAQLGHPAGLSALAHASMLIEPKTEVRAVAVTDAQRHEAVHPHETILDTGPEILEFEVWAYDPALLTPKAPKEVDPLSLYLSLKDNADERVQAALEKLMSAFPW